MSRFSVIVPVRNLATYVGRCLQSILNQSYRDFELIVVNDNSHDTSNIEVSRSARSDRRLTYIELPRTVGPGGARNVGLAKAAGEYIVFLDGDDAFADPMTLEAVSAYLDKTNNPDVLIYDFQYCDDQGRPYKASNLIPHISPSLPSVFRLADLPGAARVSWVAWNKTYRRSFVQRAGISFPPGYYEDSVWSIRCLLSAGSIAVLPRSCVHYTSCRNDSVSRLPSLNHLDVFDQYDRILDILDGAPEWESMDIRMAVIERMIIFLNELGRSRDVIPFHLLEDYHRRTIAFLLQLYYRYGYEVNTSSI